MKIIKVNCFKEAKRIAHLDPFTIENYYREFEIHELIEANEDNHYLLSDTLEKLSAQ